jgi:c-di-GMP-binding flagellar brake protein YcgR
VAVGEPLSPGKIANLSAGGCLIVFHKPQSLSHNAIVEVTFKLNDLPFRVLGQVKAVRSPTTIGFEFSSLSDRVRVRLQGLFEQLMEDLLTRNSLAAGRERRRSPRFGYSGKADIQLAARNPITSGNIVNLSAEGCLVTFQEPLSIAHDEIVEVAFKVNGLPFSLRAQAKSIRSGTSIGFKFPLLSAKARRRLEDLIEQLMETTVKRFTQCAGQD